MCGTYLNPKPEKNVSSFSIKEIIGEIDEI